MKFIWTGWRLRIERGETTKNEEETASFDSQVCCLAYDDVIMITLIPQAMCYLSYLLWPLVVGGAAYSLFYTAHRSWYSWVINSLVNGMAWLKKLAYCFAKCNLLMLKILLISYHTHIVGQEILCTILHIKIPNGSSIMTEILMKFIFEGT